MTVTDSEDIEVEIGNIAYRTLKQMRTATVDYDGSVHQKEELCHGWQILSEAFQVLSDDKEFLDEANEVMSDIDKLIGPRNVVR
jgi:hypothetical protein